MSIMPSSPEDLAGMKVTVMGLGLHGGGLESARFFASKGAVVTVTDLRDEKVLAPSLAALEGCPVRFVLGGHEMGDFEGADLVIKNPAVKADSPYLAAAKAIESDISVFLRYTASPVAAVTGSKGKSSTVSAIHFGFRRAGVDSLLGGNITVSPLSFLDETGKDRPVVLELSSWQLADLRGKGVLKPRAAVITAIMPDHMNYYSSMKEYVADKRLIYADQGPEDYTICDLDSFWGRSFAAETKACPLFYSGSPHSERGAWLEEEGLRGFARLSSGAGTPAEEILPADIHVPGAHMRKNLLAAGLVLEVFGLPAKAIDEAMASFPGVEHRLEFFAEARGVRWYNDSAATIPQAVEAALTSFDRPHSGRFGQEHRFRPLRGGFRQSRGHRPFVGKRNGQAHPRARGPGHRVEGTLRGPGRGDTRGREHGEAGLRRPPLPGMRLLRDVPPRVRQGQKIQGKDAGLPGIK
jgi:UDP-N-acetylmuramoylalanine--D-glutamate ligase